MRNVIGIVALEVIFLCVGISGVYACSSNGCSIGQIGKSNPRGTGEKWHATFLYEQVLWEKKNAQEANDLVNADHDVHDRTKDSVYHYQLGRRITDDFNITVDIPYVTKEAIEIEDTDHLGEKQYSKGLGDIHVLGEYRFWHNDQHGVSMAGGIKFPTGDTHRNNTMGERFETDMQPGSGAFNYIVGGIYTFNKGPWSIVTNASRVFTVKGAQGFEYGDLLTASLLADYLINPNARRFNTHIGMDTVFQQEWKETTAGIKNPDSGGATTLMGPMIRVDAAKNLTVTGTMLFPVSQRFNGYTQKQAFEWNVGTEVRF